MEELRVKGELGGGRVSDDAIRLVCPESRGTLDSSGTLSRFSTPPPPQILKREQPSCDERSVGIVPSITATPEFQREISNDDDQNQQSNSQGKTFLGGKYEIIGLVSRRPSHRRAPHPPLLLPRGHSIKRLLIQQNFCELD